MWVQGALPTYRRPQYGEPHPGIRDLIKHKLINVRANKYLSNGTVSSLTSFFDAPTGSDDIRMVYNATKSGLN